MQICKLENVSKEYRMGEVVSPVKELSLEINSGDFIAVEGPSGIGKSTFLYILGLLLKSDSGTHTFEGKDVSTLSDNERSELRAEKIGFIFQDPLLVQALTIKENLLFTQKITAGKEEEEEVDQLLERFGLSDRANYLPFQLSGGQRRRAMIARCLLQKPKLILADEPTNDLDEHWSEVVINQLSKAAEDGMAVVMVSHNERWSKYAKQRYRLEHGKLNPLLTVEVEG